MMSRAHLGRGLVLVAALVALPIEPAQAQTLPPGGQVRERNPILKRWVGAKHNGLPLWLDFFADTMLVVSDNVNRFVVDYMLTNNRLVIYGDSVLMRVLGTAFNRNREGEDFSLRDRFEIAYRFSLDRMIVTADDRSITMTAQDFLARRLEARWIADLPDGQRLQLELFRTGMARYRRIPGGSWVVGEWDRTFRDMELDWNPDSLELPDSTLIWHGIYDADGQQIILESVGEGTSVTILRRIIR